MKTFSAWFFLLTTLLFALGACTPGITPKSGIWQGEILINYPAQPNIVTVSFVVNPAGNQIAGWQIYDTTTRQNATPQGPQRIENSSFELSLQTRSGTTDITYSVKGTFDSPTKVTGTYIFSYGSLARYEGQWEGVYRGEAPATH